MSQSARSQKMARQRNLHSLWCLCPLSKEETVTVTAEGADERYCNWRTERFFEAKLAIRYKREKPYGVTEQQSEEVSICLWNLFIKELQWDRSWFLRKWLPGQKNWTFERSQRSKACGYCPEKSKEQQKLYDKAKSSQEAASANLFLEVHLMMLEDDDYLEAIQNMIRTEQVSTQNTLTNRR